MTKWSEEDLHRIAATDDLHVSPFREDGRTYGTPTWIWSVVVDGDLYVRAYNGTSSRWYQAALPGARRPDGPLRGDTIMTNEQKPARGPYADVAPRLDEITQ